MNSWPVKLKSSMNFILGSTFNSFYYRNVNCLGTVHENPFLCVSHVDSILFAMLLNFSY